METRKLNSAINTVYIVAWRGVSNGKSRGILAFLQDSISLRPPPPPRFRATSPRRSRSVGRSPAPERRAPPVPGAVSGWLTTPPLSPLSCFCSSSAPSSAELVKCQSTNLRRVCPRPPWTVSEVQMGCVGIEYGSPDGVASGTVFTLRQDH